jgi:hypothetical protein
MNFASPIGFTTKRPANYPAIDRSALMRDAHKIAKASRTHFATYAEALSYGLDVSEVPPPNPITERAGWLPGNSVYRGPDLRQPRSHPAHRFVDVGSLAMTMDELRNDYEARLAAANNIIAEQNHTIARLHVALMETPSQFLIGALLRDRRDESK